MVNINDEVILTLKLRKIQKFTGKIIYKNKFYFTFQEDVTGHKESYQWIDLKMGLIELVKVES